MKNSGEIESAPKKKKPTKSQLESLAAEVAAAKDAAEKQAAELHAKVLELTARAAEAGGRIAESGRETEKARQGADEARARSAEFERRIAELSSQAARVAPLEEEAAAVSFQLEESRRELGETRSRIAGLDRRILELSAEAGAFASLEKEVIELGRQVEESRRELDEARRRAGASEEQEGRLKAELEEARRARERAEEESGALRAQSAALGEEAGRAQARAADAEQRNKSLESNRVQARDSEAKLAAETATLREAIGRRDSEVRRLEEARRTLEGQLDGLRRSSADPQASPVTKPAPKEEAPAPETQAAPVAEPEPPAEPPVEAPARPAPAPAPAAAAESTAVRSRPIEMAEAILEPRNFFGPAADDGRPCHVLLELLSRDALGIVHRACERATGQHFAVRFMPGQAGEEQSAAIEQEVELLIALPHPNILQVRGSGRRQSRLYIMMDLVDAPSLGRAKIREIPRICAILRDAAEAVHYAHEEGILHGDLNPENILVGREEGRDHALVKDFGLGHLLEGLGPKTSPKEAGLAIRPPAYLAPEQMKEMKGKLSVAGDVYGLGATLYAALAGRPPFEGKDARQVVTRVMMEEPAPLERVRPELRGGLAAIVRRAMAKERNLRYASADEMAQALKKFLEGPATAIRARPAAAQE